MSTREEFGKYLLLKKLAEDALGETFRAGRLGAQGLDHVALLRVFNGPGIDTERVWAAVSKRQSVYQSLKSPNVGHGVDAGRVHGLPYVAYDYISGKDLNSLLDQADQQNTPLPLDHGLLVAERVGLALAAAYETHHEGERVLHGLLSPHLVVLSNEGETRLLGFEVGPGLAAQAANLPADVRRYASPEVRSGNAPTKADDVFSCGAILYHLLTGHALPETPNDSFESLVDRAHLAAEGTAIPAPIAALLKASLAPRSERIGDATSWHKAIVKVMAEGGFNPTTFNLAFFMHNLLRDEIERETRELDQERTIELPRAAPAPPPPRAEARSAAPANVEDTASRGRYAAAEAPEAKSKAGLWIGLAAAVLAVGAGVGWMVTRDKGPAPATDPNAAAPPVQVVPAGPTPEELQAQINKLLEEKTQAQLGQLKEEYDKRIAAMQEQLKAAQSNPPPPRGAPAPTAAPVAPAPKPEPVAEAPKPVDTAPAPTEAPAPPVVSEPEPEPAPAPPVAAPVPEPAKPVTRLGELVNAGTPGSKPPVSVRKVDPTYPAMAKRFGKQATITVRVLVDENGKVINAETVGAKAGYGFEEEALRAARASTFQPATKDNVRVKMWTTLKFVFNP